MLVQEFFGILCGDVVAVGALVGVFCKLGALWGHHGFDRWHLEGGGSQLGLRFCEFGEVGRIEEGLEPGLPVY